MCVELLKNQNSAKVALALQTNLFWNSVCHTYLFVYTTRRTYISPILVMSSVRIDRNKHSFLCLSHLLTVIGLTRLSFNLQSSLTERPHYISFDNPSSIH